MAVNPLAPVGNGALMPVPQTRAPMMGALAAPPTPGVQEFQPGDLQTPEELAALPMGPPQPQVPFNGNLAAVIDDDSYLDNLGQEICEMIDIDIESNAPHEQRFKRGLEIIGIQDFKWADDQAPFEGASSVTHPLLAEAGVQSQARAVDELNPAQGPAQTLVMGIETADKRASADRVQAHMNYQLTIEDPAYSQETEKLHLYNTWFGGAYRKAYHDPLTDRNVLRFIRGEDLILPYDATSLLTSPRVTHKFQLSDNDLKRYMVVGAYRKIEISEPAEESPTESKEMLDEIDGKVEIRANEDIVHTIYETDLNLDLQGFEDTDQSGQPTGVMLPYTVSIEKQSCKILSIRRCWKETDKLKERRMRYAEYAYFPGLGSKGYGLLHMIGSLSVAATDCLRAFLDSATFANLQGGFKAKDSGVIAGEIQIEPGTWKDVDMTAEELKNAFYTPPFHEPSPALFQVLGLLNDLGQRFSSTTDLMVGEGTKGPVGTTIAMLEQGQKVYSGVHKRGHAAVMIELRMLYELNAEYIPAEGYPYQVPGDDLQVYKADYNLSIVSVVPISDPNIFSQTQRIAQNQALYQLWKDNPTMLNGPIIIRRTLDGLKIPNPDEVIIDTDAVPQMDPVTENIAISTGRPVKAHEGENHAAHLATHMAYMNHPQFGGLPQAAKMLGGPMMAHMAEHVALLYADTMRKLGVQVPQVNLSALPGQSISQGAQDPQAQMAIAQQAQAQIGNFMQQAGLSTPPQQGQEAQERLQNAQAFEAFGLGAAALAKASTTIQTAETDLAGLNQALDHPQAPAGQGQGQTGQPGAATGGPIPHGPKPPVAPAPPQVQVHTHGPVTVVPPLPKPPGMP